MLITARFDDKNVRKYLSKAYKDLDNGLGSVIKRVGMVAKYQAMINAPYDKGYLRSSIITTGYINNRRQKSVTVTTMIDPKASRRKSFAASKWNNFVFWLHNSSRARDYDWKRGIPDFLTNDRVFRKVESEYDAMVITLLNQSFK